VTAAAAILLDGVSKSFGTFEAVREASFPISDGEFFTMLGPSGCGKTTTLRMIAGFEQPTAGRIELRGVDVTDVPANRRNVNMVFQQRVALARMEKRKPSQLSGGQTAGRVVAHRMNDRPPRKSMWARSSSSSGPPRTLRCSGLQRRARIDRSFVRAQVRVGVDVGGSFTDAVLLDRSRLVVAKVRTTPAELAQGFLDALATLAERSGLPSAAISYLVHGSTLATNAIVEGRLARVGLLTTAGFRDVLEIGTQMRPRLYDLHYAKPPPLVSRELRLEARERIGPSGEVVVPLDAASVEAAAKTFREAGVEAVAVCFLFSFANPAHEREAGRLLGLSLPGTPVSLSSDVASEYREYLRTSTTALNASLLPLVGRYVDDLAARLAHSGVAAPLHLMQSNGGLATAEDAARLPVGLIASGPAAGVIGAARFGALAGDRDILSFDMGGTTADVGLVSGGEPVLRYRGEAAGHPVNLPQIDVLSVGAGGGSIARVDRFGSLLVGPESAGAEPGPAAYGAGGEEATVTDAHVALGTLDPEHFLGGRMGLDVRAARRTIERRVARPLRLGVEEAAAAVIRVADATMVRALRVISVARGHDPRRFALLALGGAGPMHACGIAEELGMRRVVIPRYPGVAAALGLLASDLRYDLSQTWVRPTAQIRGAELRRRLTDLERNARELLASAGFADGRARIEFRVDMRYRGQAYPLTVPLRPGALNAAERAFHAAHRRAYGYSSPVGETEVVTLRVRGTGRVRQQGWDGLSESGGVSDGSAWRTVGGERYAIYERATLGATARGPAIVEQEDSTIVVAPGWRLETGAAGSLILSR